MLSSHDQLLCLFRCLGFGVCTAIFYDLFRLYRLFTSPSPYKLFFLDVFFCLTVGIAFYLFSLAANAGTVRSWMVIAATVGGAVWCSSFSKLWIAFARRLHAIYKAIAHYVTRKAKNAQKMMAKTANFLLIFSKNLLRRLQLLVYNKKCE